MLHLHKMLVTSFEHEISTHNHNIMACKTYMDSTAGSRENKRATLNEYRS